MPQHAFGCLNGAHHHRVVMQRRPIDRDDEPGADGYLTLWVCPVLRTLGALWEEYDPQPRDGVGPGGPLL